MTPEQKKPTPKIGFPKQQFTSKLCVKPTGNVNQIAIKRRRFPSQAGGGRR